MELPDVHEQRPRIALALRSVGVLGLELGQVRLGGGHAWAWADAFVDLPANMRGVHLSRTVRALLENEWGPDACCRVAERLLELHPYSTRSLVRIRGRCNCAGGRRAWASEACEARRGGGPPTRIAGASFEVVTACPCALEVSRALYGLPYTHMQRAVVRFRVRSRSILDVGGLLRAASEGLARPADALRRADEASFVRAVVESPMFAEDVARAVALGLARALSGDPGAEIYVVVRSLESIHGYDVVASYRGSAASALGEAGGARWPG
ncbi:MAG: GTP cyclohydrolase, FolE2/MptA family [Desulfurococcaceae archaeon]